MKAIIYTEYGSPDVLQFRNDIEKPTPKDDEILVKIHAVGFNAADKYLLKGTPFFLRFESGLLKPKNEILGADIAGRVEAVGKNVKQFQLGDDVYGDLSGSGWGGLAEYVAVPESQLALKPSNLTFEESAAVPMAAITALQALRDKGHIQAGQKVLINGASGGVGTFAVQIAKVFGAEVTAVCSTSKIDHVRSIGADHVIDYKKEDFTQSGLKYDLILAANGYHSVSAYKRALNPEGSFVCSGGTMRQIFQSMLLGPLMSIGGSKMMGSMIASPNQSDLQYMTELLETGKVKPMIDRCYPLDETVDAMRYLDKGHAFGKVIITI